MDLPNNPEFRVKCASSDAFVRFYAGTLARPEYFFVDLHSGGLTCSTRVYAYEPRGVSLASLFDDLAKHWRGWPGEKTWESLEGEVKLQCSSDHSGHVTINVTVRDGVNRAWQASAILQTEAGLLDQLRDEAAAFLRSVLATHS